MIGSTVAMIEPTRAGGKAESDGTVPQIRPVKTMTVNEKRMGSWGRNPTQPSIPHSRPDTQENAAASVKPIATWTSALYPGLKEPARGQDAYGR